MAPDRLYGVACIPTYDIDHGVAELEWCRQAGLPGAMVWQAPPAELSLNNAGVVEEKWEISLGRLGDDKGG